VPTNITGRELSSELRKLGWHEENGANHKKYTPPGGLKQGERPLVVSHGWSEEITLAGDMVRNLEALGHPGKQALRTLRGLGVNGGGNRVMPRKKRVTSSSAPESAANGSAEVPLTFNTVVDAPPNVNRQFGQLVGGGIRAQVVKITPIMAERWLDQHGGPNRKVLESRVERYKNDIVAGRFQGVNGETVVFDSNNQLADGQHRLKAIVAAEKAITTLVVWGVAPLEAQRTMDTGATRSLRDLIGMAGGKHEAYVANATANAWRLRKLGAFEQGGSAQQATPQQLIQFLCDNWILYTTDAITYQGDEDKAEQLFKCDSDIPRWAVGVNKRLSIGIPHIMTLHWLFFAHTDAAPEEVKRFFETTVDGFEMKGGLRVAFDPGDSRALIHKTIVNRKELGGWNQWPTMRRFAYFIKAWNNWRNGIVRQQLTWRPNGGESFPRPV
jgi:hypothetical protein